MVFDFPQKQDIISTIFAVLYRHLGNGLVDTYSNQKDNRGVTLDAYLIW